MKIMEPTYESIKSLIVREIWIENQVQIQFKATNQEQPFETTGIAAPNVNDAQKNIAKDTVKSVATNTAINAGGSFLGNLFGRLTGFYGAGSVVSTVASTAGQMGVDYKKNSSTSTQAKLTDEVKKQTILDAFKPFMSHYEFQNNVWVYKN
jgi:hypothetical protein